MVQYWPEKGKSGFLVWRYLLKRDDDEPAPWTRDGKERIKKLGLIMQVRTHASCLMMGSRTRNGWLVQKVNPYVYGIKKDMEMK